MWKIQFFDSLHSHFRDGVLYEGKDPWIIKLVLWKKSPLLYLSAVTLRTFLKFMKKKLHIYTTKTMFIFFKWFFLPQRSHPSSATDQITKNILSPPKYTLYFQKFFADSSKSIHFSKKILCDINILHEILLLMVYQWPL